MTVRVLRVQQTALEPLFCELRQREIKKKQASDRHGFSADSSPIGVRLHTQGCDRDAPRSLISSPLQLLTDYKVVKYLLTLRYAVVHSTKVLYYYYYYC